MDGVLVTFLVDVSNLRKEGFYFASQLIGSPSWQGGIGDRSMRQLFTLHLKSGRETGVPMGWCYSFRVGFPSFIKPF